MRGFNCHDNRVSYYLNLAPDSAELYTESPLIKSRVIAAPSRTMQVCQGLEWDGKPRVVEYDSHPSAWLRAE